MNAKRILLGWSVIGLFLMVFGCSNDAGDVATAPDGVEIHFDRQGEGRPVLIFVHGWANDRTIWDTQVAHFSQKYEVINLDLPGFGESGNEREEFTIESYGDDVATIIQQRNLEQAVLVGFSMGGPVVIEAAIRVPGQVAGVVLVDDLHDVEAKTPPEAIGDAVAFYLDVVTNPTNEKLVSGGFYTKDTEAAFNRIAAILEGGPRVGWRESILDAARWVNEDCIESISRVQAPIISINSDLRPTDVEAFRKYVPSYQVKIVPDTGHLVMWDAPDAFNQMLEESIQELMSR
jgi:pimeloyl-ACP methyl ester carboxylesterase